MNNQWKYIEDNIVKRFDIYSTADFNPKKEDVEYIISKYSLNNTIGIGIEGDNVRIYRNGIFVKMGEYFKSGNNPSFSTLEQCMILDYLRKNLLATKDEIFDELKDKIEKFENVFNSCINDKYIEDTKNGYRLGEARYY